MSYHCGKYSLSKCLVFMVAKFMSMHMQFLFHLLLSFIRSSFHVPASEGTATFFTHSPAAAIVLAGSYSPYSSLLASCLSKVNLPHATALVYPYNTSSCSLSWRVVWRSCVLSNVCPLSFYPASLPHWCIFCNQIFSLSAMSDYLVMRHFGWCFL